MDIEAYLDRRPDEGIFVRGTRVDLWTIIEAYRDGLSPEEIAVNYPTLMLQQVYAVLTYYLAHQQEIELAHGGLPESARLAEAPVVQRLRVIASRRGSSRSRAARASGG